MYSHRLENNCIINTGGNSFFMVKKWGGRWMLSRHESDHIWVLCYGKCVCACIFFFCEHCFWQTDDRQKKEKVLLTRGAEGGSQCWRARGQATLRMRSRGWWRRGGGWRGRRGGGASSRQGGRRGGQPLSRLHICQTQSNQQGYNSKAHPSVHLQTHMLKHKHTHIHTHQWILSHLHSMF